MSKFYIMNYSLNIFYFIFCIFGYFIFTSVKMKNQTYNTVGRLPKSYRKKSQKGAKSIPLTHIYMTAHIIGLVQILQ